MRKIAIVVVTLVPESVGKNNIVIEEEILANMPQIPWSARIEKVTVLDCP
jgi:hypothetical protein